MTTVTTTTPTRRSDAAARSTARHVTFGRVVAAEWTKFRSLRSTTWSLAMYVAAMVAIPLLVAWATTQLPEDTAGGEGPVASLLSAGWQMGQLVVVVLGALAITSEYSTGLVRATFAAVPRRVPALAAKAIVLAGAVAVATVVAQALAYLVTMPFHDDLGATLDLGADGTVRMLAGPALYMVAVTLLGLGVGALLRHTAAAISTVVALLLVIETVIMMVPFRLFELISPYLPSTAGSRVMLDPGTLAMLDEMANGTQLAPWTGYGVLVAWVAVLLGASVVLLRARDA